jgi:magnesium-transporting ATPase (P-type)
MLTLTAERMKAVSVLVKKTDIVEALGSATRIASDKTGTLTQNQMTVMNCWVNRQYKSAGEILASAHRPGAIPTVRPALSKTKQLLGGLGSGSLTDWRRGGNPADVSEIEMSLPPAAQKIPGAGVMSQMSTGKTALRNSNSIKTSVGTTSRFGQDMASRMSMGKASVSQVVCSVPLYE